MIRQFSPFTDSVVNVFGFIKGFHVKVDDLQEDFDKYKSYKNQLSKDLIVKYIEKLKPYALAPTIAYEIFTKEPLRSNIGLYLDDDFLFPTEFLYYYKNYDIGIPPEYEEHIKKKLKG
ncbi:MAG: hypothetical protein GYA87_10365 [Christensenellaceae bacterium]|nr:hypothetical protein [Christensenellaceae bacterium]